VSGRCPPAELNRHPWIRYARVRSAHHEGHGERAGSQELPARPNLRQGGDRAESAQEGLTTGHSPEKMILVIFT
jgi:hypothetical protein